MCEPNNMDYQSGIDIRTHIETLGKHKGFILVFFFSAALASLGSTYFVSERYQAATTIFYRPLDVSLLRQKEIETFGARTPTAPFKVISQTLRDAVRNEAVLRPVVEALKLDQEIEVEYDTWYERWYEKTKTFIKDRLKDLWQLLKYGRLVEQDPKVAAITGLSENVDIVTNRDSYIHVLKAKDKYPQRAARIVDLAGQGMVDWLRKQQQRQTEERVRQLEQRVTAKQAQILDLQDRRKKLLEDNDLVSISEETARALSNFYEMQLEDVRIRAQIQKKEREVAEYEQRTGGKANTYVQSEDIKNMRSAKTFGEIELEGLKAESSFMASSLKDLEDRLAKLPLLQQRLDMLDLQIASATREHEHLKDLYIEASAQITPAQSETRVLHAAAVPSAPVQPIKVYHVGLTALLSLFFAAGLAYLMDFVRSGPSNSLTKGKGDGNASQASTLAAVSKELRQTSQALKEFAREMAAEGGSLFLRRRDSLILAQSLDPGHAPAAIPLPLRKGSVFEQVMATGQPVLIEDIEHKVGVHSSGWKGYRDNSLLAFPLSSRTGETIGVVSLHNKAGGHFTQQDKERGIELQASKLSILAPSFEALAASLAQKVTEPVTDKVVGLGPKAFHLDEFAESLDAEGGSLFLRRQEELVLAQSLDPGHAPAAIPLPLRNGSVFERVMDAKEPLLIRNIGDGAEVQLSGWTGYKDRSSLVFPLVDESGEIAGIVSLHNKRSGPFTEKDKQRGVGLLAARISDKAPRRGMHPILRYPIIIACGAILAALVFYLLSKIGY
jgi:uncharacterized protein involved in exopolysaccharide biosynthesis